jgi:hypothetical protein
MSERGGSDLNATQLVAGGLATATAAVAASYLGVAGTIIGAAFTSVATTVGAAIYKHYLDRGKSRYVAPVTGEIRYRLGGHAVRPASAAPEEAETPGTTRVESAAVHEDGPAVTRVDPPAVAPAGEQADETRMAGEAPRPRTARRPRWYVLSGAAFAIFAVVIGGITLVESLANKPLSAMVGRSDRSGTSLGDTFGDGNGSRPAEGPAVPSNSVTTTPTELPSAVPSSSPPAVPSTTATPPILPSPSGPSSTATTRPPALPSGPAPESSAP